MNGKFERFVTSCKNSTSGFLIAKKRVIERRNSCPYRKFSLSIYSAPRGSRGVKLSTINPDYDLPVGVTPFGLISMVMSLYKIGYLYVEDAIGRTYVYTHKDLYRANRHFENVDARDVFERLIKRACERDRNIHFDMVSPAIEEVKKIADEVRQEIYYLFRFFSDAELKKISSAMLGTSKKYNDDVVKVQQLIKRISNYNDRIGETVELIEKFEREFEEKHQNYWTCSGYGKNSYTDGSVTYKAVLNFIEAARKGSEEYYKQHQ